MTMDPLYLSLVSALFIFITVSGSPVVQKHTNLAGLDHSLVESMVQQVGILSNKFDQLELQLGQISQNSNWPAGSYCILQHQICPNGFQQHNAKLVFKRDSFLMVGGIKGEKFGESQILDERAQNQVTMELKTCCTTRSAIQTQ